MSIVTNPPGNPAPLTKKDFETDQKCAGVPGAGTTRS